MQTIPDKGKVEVRYLTAAETAALVREQLKQVFPGTKFSVRKSDYSMGASMRVRWTDGPTEQAVRSVAARYEGSGFDAMQDLKYPLEPTLVAWRDGSMSLVHFGVDTVHVNREISPAYEALLAEHATALVREQTNGRLVFDRQTRYTEPFIDPAGRTIPWPLNGHELLRELSRHIAAPAGAPAARKRKA